ncbi:MAG: hypothetical protein R6T83_09610 [Salinibacter sp.]
MALTSTLQEALGDAAVMARAGTAQAAPRGASPNRIAFGTVVRAAPVEKGGELVVLDWERKEITASVSMMPREPSVEDDPNPRGNTRGCRGIRWHDDELIAASYHTLERYDAALNRTGTLSDGLMVGLHEIETTDGGTVWVTSTAIDAAVEYDLATGERVRALWPREDAQLQAALGLQPLALDKSADNRLRFLGPTASNDDSHLHLNAVAVSDDRVYGLCNAHAAIVDLSRGEVVVQDEALQGAHNLRITPDGTALSNDTYGRAVCVFDLAQGARLRTIDLTRYEWVRALIRPHIPSYWREEVARKVGWKEDSIARPLFVRGLTYSGEHLFVGVSPASILQIDWATGELVDAYCYSTDVRACIHGLEAME